MNKKGEVVSKPKSITMHYVRGWFIVDLLAALPFDFLYVLNLYSRDPVGTSIHPADARFY